MTMQATSSNAVHSELGSPPLANGELAAISTKFAEGYARIRDVTDRDGACPAWAKALYMACAASVRGQRELTLREMTRSRELGLSLGDARGASLAVLISRGEATYNDFARAIDRAFDIPADRSSEPIPDFSLDRQAALDYFESYFGFVPDYIEVMADNAPRALEGYVLMRQWSLAENTLDAKHVELLLCTINAAEFSSRFVNIHANGARNAGASEAEITEAVVCAIPISGVASWLPGADGIMEGR
ncbi:carboxymuconolactone decarboxylase family protein [Candidatus Poriferisocius sp.]|uniref:carboxymuconolactone decarboxylase family protein n=1 Tax=Candidatus Poriferisocius sp. TaxID=3101276 RepID=UPI003B01BE84